MDMEIVDVLIPKKNLSGKSVSVRVVHTSSNYLIFDLTFVLNRIKSDKN